LHSIESRPPIFRGLPCRNNPPQAMALSTYVSDGMLDSILRDWHQLLVICISHPFFTRRDLQRNAQYHIDLSLLASTDLNRRDGRTLIAASKTLDRILPRKKIGTSVSSL